MTAKTLFLTSDDLPTALATTLAASVSTQAAKAPIAIDEPRAPGTGGKAGRLMTEEEKKRVRIAIQNATSAEEIRKLERSLKEGWMPPVGPVGA